MTKCDVKIVFVWYGPAYFIQFILSLQMWPSWDRMKDARQKRKLKLCTQSEKSIADTGVCVAFKA